MGTVGIRGYTFSEEEIVFTRSKFPKLTLVSESVWDGIIDIDATYNDIHIVDSFQVKIGVFRDFPTELPIVNEVGGRIKVIADKYGITDYRDLHANPRTDTICLCVKQEEKYKVPPGSTFVDFLNNLVVPYFFGLSYYEKNRVWPWGEYSHGGLGLLEYYSDNKVSLTSDDLELLTSNLKRDEKWKSYSKRLRDSNLSKKCVCGSEKPFNSCHTKAADGMSHVLSEVHRLHLSSYKLFKK